MNFIRFLILFCIYGAHLTTHATPRVVNVSALSQKCLSIRLLFLKCVKQPRPQPCFFITFYFPLPFLFISPFTWVIYSSSSFLFLIVSHVIFVLFISQFLACRLLPFYFPLSRMSVLPFHFFAPFFLLAVSPFPCLTSHFSLFWLVCQSLFLLHSFFPTCPIIPWSSLSQYRLSLSSFVSQSLSCPLGTF